MYGYFPLYCIFPRKNKEHVFLASFRPNSNGKIFQNGKNFQNGKKKQESKGLVVVVVKVEVMIYSFT